MEHDETSAAVRPIDRLFNAKSVAIIGASPDQTKLSSSPLNAFANLGYGGSVYAVNPRYDTLHGRACYHSVAELPDDVEAAMIMLPANLALDAVEACAERGIRALVVPAQGFGEAGEHERDAKLLTLARRHGLAVCGPNTNGLANVASGLTMSFAPIFQYQGTVVPGSVSVVSQSGAMVSSLLTHLNGRGLGIAKTATCGNELILGVADYVRYLAEDSATRVIVLFLETIRDLPALREALAQCRRHDKPVVALKIGESDRGQRAALSHTGAIAGSYRNTVAFLRREGVLVAEDLETLAATTECVLRYKWPLATPPKLFVMAISGGFAALAADTMARLGVELPDPSAMAAEQLRALPTQSHPVNPYDIAAQNALIPSIIEIFRRDGFNQLLFGLALLKPEIRAIVLQMIVDAKRAGLDQIFVASPDLGASELQLLHEHGISVSGDIRPLLLALRCLREHAEDAETAEARDPDGAATVTALPALGEVADRTTGAIVDEAASKAWLRELGFRTPSSQVIRGSLELAALAKLRRPLVMKGISSRIAHKSDHGLVALNLRTDEELRTAYERIRAALANTDPSSGDVLVEEMIESGLEAIVGIQRDPVIGPVVVIGAGGILTELLGDAIVLVPPFSSAQVRTALGRTRFGRVLSGFRGRSYDVDALANLAVSLGREALAHARLEAVDINPVLVQPGAGGVVAVDAKLYLAVE